MANRRNPGVLAWKSRPGEVKESASALSKSRHGLHGAKLPLFWFPFPWRTSACVDKFGYMAPQALRNISKLPFTAANRALLDRLGDMMGDLGRETGIGDSPIPAGFTYVGQFVDHDITLDVHSNLDVATNAEKINNMRSPSLDLDSLYARGPALDPFLYDFPDAASPSTAIKFALGSNQQNGPGGPGGNAGQPGMVQKSDFDLPRIHNPLSPAGGSLTAVIGDPRNDENLIVSQFHHAMLRFHNRVVDDLVTQGFGGDIFVEAKRLVTHHYQWAVVHDFLPRICGAAAVNSAMQSVVALPGSPFRMPVEFSVAAYRFGHSMIRDRYWLNFNFIDQPLSDAFAFIRKPHLPVRSNWVIDFNAFFETGVPVPVFNRARKIDSVLANGLEALPGFSGMMAVLARRNLLRGLALGLPSGQAMAALFGLAPLTPAQLTAGLPANEVALLRASGGLLLKKTPLWYYVLREAAVARQGDQLGPVGAAIVARTFVQMLKRDGSSYLHWPGGFAPGLPSRVAGQFNFADLVTFAGVTQP
jgi:Animal haem peroxidase